MKRKTHLYDFFHADPGELDLNKVVETKLDTKDLGNCLAQDFLGRIRLVSLRRRVQSAVKDSDNRQTSEENGSVSDVT